MNIFFDIGTLCANQRGARDRYTEFDQNFNLLMKGYLTETLKRC